MLGRVRAIFVAPRAAAPMQRVAGVDALAGRGLAGDRYAEGRGSFSRWPGARREVTLVDEAALLAAEREFGVRVMDGEHRRNLVVAGVPLVELVRRPFRVGGALLKGVQVCAPCRNLVRVSAQEDLFDALVGRGGLRAQILEGGPIREGDMIEAV
jgi:MOSC domain-containing protein YiiM